MCSAHSLWFPFVTPDECYQIDYYYFLFFLLWKWKTCAHRLLAAVCYRNSKMSNPWIYDFLKKFVKNWWLIQMAADRRHLVLCVDFCHAHTSHRPNGVRVVQNGELLFYYFMKRMAMLPYAHDRSLPIFVLFFFGRDGSAARDTWERDPIVKRRKSAIQCSLSTSRRKVGAILHLSALCAVHVGKNYSSHITILHAISNVSISPSWQPCQDGISENRNFNLDRICKDGTVELKVN